MSENVIKITNLSKKYILKHQKPTLVENIFNFGKKEEIFALKDVNLKIKKGSKIGIIGNNGSGKTTLLKVIAGITNPTFGEVKVNGRVAALLDLQAGFHPELSGNENIYLNGMLLGMKKQEIKNSMNKIKDFANLGKFIETPFYTYSSGMALRLGFSIAIHSNPDILLMDDNTMFVGDKAFRQKIRDKVNQLNEKGKTVLFVTHWAEYLRENTDELVLLNKGQLIMKDCPDKVINYYSGLKKG
jgi:lipopolysaccharide transport system ATP-binding protein